MKNVVLGAVLVISGIAIAGQPAFVDEFDQVDLNARWEFYTPSAGPVYELDGDNFILDMPSGDYDSWANFDRCPRLRTSNFDTAADFSVETHVEVEWPTTATYFQTGIWVGFQDLTYGVIDGWFFGFYSAPGWVGPHTLRTERVGNWSTGYGDNATPVPWGTADAYLRIERIGTKYLFYYKQLEADPWILFHTSTSAGQTVIDTGLFAKNWGGLAAAVRADFSYFRLSDPLTVAPVLVDPGDAIAIVDMPFCLQVGLGEGFPLPTWTIGSWPVPVNSMTISPTGRIEFLPAAADLGKTFPFNVTATNAAGTDSTTVNVKVVDELSDDFDGPDLAAGLKLAAPIEGPTVTLPGDGWATLAHNGLGTDGLTNFDSWVGFDRMPRIQAQVPACGDFVVETLMSIPTSTLLEPADYHVGIYVGMDDPVIDGFFFGPYRAYTDLKLERVGAGHNVVPLEPWSELALRVERRADTYLLMYKTDSDDDWLDYGSIDGTLYFPGKTVRYVGLCSKNWAGNPGVSVSFDYFTFGVPVIEAPTLVDLCPAADNLATVGDPFVKRFEYLPGTPKATTVSVAPVGAFDKATGLYSVTPAAAGTTTVTLTATMDGADPVVVSFDLKVIERGAFFEDFEEAAAEDLPFKTPPRELYNPLAIEEPFTIVGDVGAKKLELAVLSATEGGAVYDSWSTMDNAPQLRVQAAELPDDLGADFTIETKLTLTQYTAGTPFQFGLAVGFDINQMFYWGPYMGTNVRLEYSGANALYDGVCASPTVTLRIRRECDLYYFSYKPEGEDWVFATTWATPPLFTTPPSFVGLFVKTWAGTGATAKAEFEYFDIVAERAGPTTYVIATSASPAAGGTTTGGGVYASGSNVTVQAIPNDGYTFVDWTEGATSVSTTPSYTFTATADRTLVANFLPTMPLVNVKVGETNDDGRVDIGDAVYLLGYLFASGPEPPCKKAADTNDSDAIDIADAIKVLAYLFAKGDLILPDGTAVTSTSYPGCVGYLPEDVNTLGCLNPCSPTP